MHRLRELHLDGLNWSSLQVFARMKADLRTLTLSHVTMWKACP